MAGERTFVVKILGDAGSAVAAFKKLQAEGEKATGALGVQSKQLQDIFKQVTIAAAAGFASGVALLTSSVNAAIQDQQEQVKLAQALKNTTGATTEQIAETERLITQMSLASGVADSELRPALATLALGSGSLARAQQDLALAQDIATSTSVPLGQVADALSKSYNDNFKALKALSPALADNIKEGQSLEQIFGELNAQFGGATQAAAGTAAGQMQILKVQMAELSESIGAALVPALAAVLPLFQALATFAQNHSTLFAGLVITFTAVAGAVLLYATYLKLLPLRIAAVAAAQAIWNALLIANPLGLFIAGVAALTLVIIQVTGNLEGLWIATKKVVNGFNSLLNIVLPLDIPMMNVNKRTEEIAQTQYRSIPIAEQIGTKYLEIAGACREILKVPIAKQLETQADRLTQLAFSLGVTRVSYDQFDKATGGASKTVETAAEKMKKYTDALKQSEVASKSYSKSQKATADAQKSLNSANTDLAAAQDRFNKAVAGYGADSAEAKAAQKELSKAQRNVEAAGYRVEESVFAVRDAELKLAELRADPTSSAQAIRQAEIDLAEAKLSVKEATEAQEEATNGLAEAQLILNEAVNGAVVGSDLYNKLLKEVDDAKERQTSASEKLADAVDAETEAYERLAEAIKAAGDAAKNTGRTGLTIPSLPTVPTPGMAGGGGTSGTGGAGTNININTGIGTNGVEAGRQIVEVLQQYSRIAGGNFLEFAVA